ncbi:hypothetical protein [Ferruginibacter albus]|uniref:hypothetical protein n=1 Tax=Ferruginibacter albus TaxID=2875540 RepID=UPI001CC59414|nr:hypothetical protein [Ferruginibacter albus]UAY51302.1 hypothetical protein K9M53_11960 [Ferruginibacter albus]
MYPIYHNFYYSNGLLTYERHRAVIEKRSEFYNPWQYRVLCPYTIEGMLWVYNHTVDKVYPVEQKIHFNIQSTSGTNEETEEFIKLMQTPGAIKYMILFILFRFIEHVFIFYLTWRLWNYFIKNKWLLFFALNFLAISLGNAGAAADLTFNTYLDIIFYLIAANMIVYGANSLWLFVIIPFAAFNRETSMMIPALYFISQTDFTQFSFKKLNINKIGWPKKSLWLQTAALYVIFFSIFFYLRWYFGYRPQQVWKVPSGLPMLKLNLFSAVGVKAYFELIGTFGIIPIILYKFKSFPHLLKKWFLFLVPVWFLIHYVSVVAYQPRLFMVPLILIFMPMLLWLIDKEGKRDAQLTHDS